MNVNTYLTQLEAVLKEIKESAEVGVKENIHMVDYKEFDYCILQETDLVQILYKFYEECYNEAKFMK